jgi:hypothetical protein
MIRSTRIVPGTRRTDFTVLIIIIYVYIYIYVYIHTHIHISLLNSSGSPGLLYIYFYNYNHARRLRLEKLLCIGLSRSPNGLLKCGWVGQEFPKKNETAKAMPTALAFINCTWRRKNSLLSRMRRVFLTRFLYGEVAPQSLKNTLWG